MIKQIISRTIEDRSKQDLILRYSLKILNKLHSTTFVSEHVDNARKENCWRREVEGRGVVVHEHCNRMNLSSRPGWTRSPAAPLSEGILAVNQIPDLRPVHVYINSATSRLSGRQKRSWSRSLLFRWIRANAIGKGGKHPRDSSLPLSTPHPLLSLLVSDPASADSSFAEPFSRSFRADDASADLQPIRYFAWKPDIRVPFFLTFAFPSLEFPSNETRGGGKKGGISERENFRREEIFVLLRISVRSVNPATFNFSSRV